MERAHALPYCTAYANVFPGFDAVKLFPIFGLIRSFEHQSDTKSVLLIHIGTAGSLKGEAHLDWLSNSAAEAVLEPG